MKTSGNTVLITGGGSGIGLSLATALLERGNRVLIVGRSIKRLNTVSEKFPEIQTFICDVSSAEQRDDLILEIERHYPDLNLLINNAGVQFNYPSVGDFSESQNLAKEIDTNLLAPVELTRLLLPTLLSHKEAAIVNITSALAIVPKKNAPGYCASKGGLHIFSQSLRALLDGTTVKVFEIIPPLVDTEMTQGRGSRKISPEQLVDEFFQKFKRGRFEISIGKVRVLKLLARIFPSLALKIMKNRE